MSVFTYERRISSGKDPLSGYWRSHLSSLPKVLRSRGIPFDCVVAHPLYAERVARVAGEIALPVVVRFAWSGMRKRIFLSTLEVESRRAGSGRAA